MPVDADRLRRLRLARALVALPALLLACSPTGDLAETAADAEPGFDLATAQIVDLSHPYDADTLYWPNMPSGFELEVLARGVTPAGFFYSSNLFSTPEHGGTHLDAPIHFAAGGWAADEIPLERLLGPAVVIDVARQAAADPDYRLTVADVTAWEAEHGRVPEAAIVLLATGWSERWPNRRAYLGDDVPGKVTDLHFPAYGEDAARLLVEQRRVAVLGVDTASLDHGPSTDFIVHQIAGEANVAGLENLTRLDRLPATGAWVVALPMKIAGGSGGPARVVALMQSKETLGS